MIAGQVKYFFSNGSSSVGLVQGGKVKAIAHTGKGRLGTLPDLPAVQDTIPGFEAYEWNGVFVPTGTSPEIVKKLNAGLNEVLRQPDVVARFKSLNIDFKAEHAGRIPRLRRRRRPTKWGKVVREAGIKLGWWVARTCRTLRGDNHGDEPIGRSAPGRCRTAPFACIRCRSPSKGLFWSLLGLLAVLLPPLATLGVTIFWDGCS